MTAATIALPQRGHRHLLAFENEGGSAAATVIDACMSILCASGSSSSAIDLSRDAYRAASERLLELRDRPTNWDSRGSLRPAPESLELAEELLGVFFAAATYRGKQWVSPHLSSSELGKITMEWWAGSRKLTIYADDAEPSYIKVWGADIDNEMEDGLIRESSPVSLWSWLVD